MYELKKKNNEGGRKKVELKSYQKNKE